VRILVTNDDGIASPGLHALARWLDEAGHDVLVVAPQSDMSGVGAAIGRIDLDHRVDVAPASIPGAPGIRALALNGPPGLAAMSACIGAFGDRPDLVVSGINAGPNTGHACLHSGTVGAALTAATFGVSALAVSLDVGDEQPWATACGRVATPLAILADAPAGTVLNLNVPAVEPDAVRGLRWAKLDPFGRVRLAVASQSDLWLQMEYRATQADIDPCSDSGLLDRGYATLTAIRGIAEIPPDEIDDREDGAPRIEARLASGPEEG